MSGVSVAVAVVGAVVQQQAASKAAKAQRNAADQQREAIDKQTQAGRDAEAAKGRMAEVQAQRERIQQVREARIKRSAIVASAGNVGIGAGTSGVSGSTSSIGSQASANIGSINQQQTFAADASAANQQAADASAAFQIAGAEGNVAAAKWQAVGAIGSSVFQGAGGWTTIFGGNTPTKAKA